MRNLTPYETRDYPWSLSAMRKRYENKKAEYDTLREACQGLMVKEAMTSADLAGTMPDVFTPELIRVGQLEAIARNTFPSETQSTHDEFKTRLRSRSDGAGIAREQDELKHSKSSRETDTNTFCKIYDWPIHSWEKVDNSDLNEIQDDLAYGLTRMYRRENQIAAHQLTLGSTGDKLARWTNWRLIAGSGAVELGALQVAMRASYINMTTRLQDRVDPSQLRWLMSPAVYALLWEDETLQTWATSGMTPVQYTGRIPNPLGVPITVMETGYFAAKSVWTPTADVFLIAPSTCAANKFRVDIRMEPWSDVKTQTIGPCMWERYGFYIRRYFQYERLSITDDYSDILKSIKYLKIDPKTDDAVATPDDGV